MSQCGKESVLGDVVVEDGIDLRSTRLGQCLDRGERPDQSEARRGGLR